MKGLFISGSSTDVGKTFIAEQIIRLLSESRRVAVRKPVESDCKTVDGRLVTQDAQTLLNTSNVNDDIDTVCPYKFSQCCSGESASAATNVTLTSAQLFDACQSDDYVVVEGAGGLLSPIAQNTLNIDLAAALNLPLIIIVKDKLGAVNQALLTIKVAEQYQLKVACIVLNQFEANTLNNADAIRRYSECEVVIYNDKSAALFRKKMRQILSID